MSDATYQSAKSLLGGERGVVDLIGLVAYYQMASMLLKAGSSSLVNVSAISFGGCPTVLPGAGLA